MRWLALVATVVLGVACERIDLEKTPRAYACDHLGGDGGRQCTDDWRCAFADKCFHRDAGAEVAALDWQCTEDLQCPDGWQCGLEVEGRRHCQQLGVGAPSPCRLDAGDCQGAWRCGLDDRCFDPSKPGAGAQTECMSDATCPDGFRCGETVDRVRRCVELGVPVVNAPCATDLSCEGGLRCDTFAQVCVEVTDVLDSGHLDTVGVVVVSRKQSRPVPLMISATRRGLTPRPDGSGVSDAVVMGALYDGGVLHSMQFASDTEGPEVIDTWLELSPHTSAQVKDLVVTSRGAAVHYSDRSIELLLLDGGSELVTSSATLLRPFTVLHGTDPSDFLWTEGPRAWLPPGDAGFTVPGGPDAGSPDILEIVNVHNETWAFTRAGVFRHHAGSLEFQNASPVRFERTSALAAGRVPLSTPGDEYKVNFVFLVPMDGGVELQPWLWVPGDRLATTSAPIDACPDDLVNSRAEAVAFASEPNSAATVPSAIVRCVRPDGSSYAVKARFREQQGSITVRIGPYAEDPVPFSRPWVAMHHAPFARAFAGSERELWLSTDRNQGSLADGLALLGDYPLRSVVLDRAPTTILDYRYLGQQRLTAVSNGDMLVASSLGFLSQTGLAGDLALLAPTNSPSWIITSLGVLDLKATETAQSPTMSAAPANGVRLSSPASGGTALLEIAGQPRHVLLVAAGDTVWAADVTDNLEREFAPPATLTPVMVPTPGIALSSLVIEGDPAVETQVLSGYVTTASTTLQFKTSDLVHWAVTTVARPATADYPIEAWVEGHAGRVGTADGKVWSLPLMVELSRGLPDAGTALDYAKLCDDVFVTTSRGGVLRARPSTGGLPAWEPLDPVNASFTDATALKLYATNERLFVSDPTGRVVEVTRAHGADGGCP